MKHLSQTTFGWNRIAAALALPAFPAALFAAPLLHNGSFEHNGASPGTNPLAINANGPGAPLFYWEPEVVGPQGNIGRNTEANPFYDNGAIPHGRNVAFLQRNVKITQNVRGFEAGKTYTLTFAVNRRATATVSDPAILQVEVGGSIVLGPENITNVEAAGNYTLPWTTYSIDISPGAGNHEIAFINNATEDISLLIDNVRLYEKNPAQPVVVNGSFEFPGQSAYSEAIFDWAARDTTPSDQQRGTPAGWVTLIDASSPIQRVGQTIAGSNPFYDNGLVPDGDQVVFIQNIGAVEQTIPGFQAGTDYVLQLRVNARDGGTGIPDLQVSLDGTPIPGLTQVDVAPLESAGSRTLEFATYTATISDPGAGTHVVTIANTDNVDCTLLIDDFIIAPVGPQDIDGPASLDIGNAAASTPVTRSFEVTNTGTDPLSITGITVTGTDAADFTVTSPSTFPLTVNLGDEVEVAVQYSSAVTGDSSASIDIASNDPDEATFSVAVTGSVPATPEVFNGSFEIDAMGVWPGSVVPTGWTSTGGTGVVNPSFGRLFDNYFDNGMAPDGQNGLRIQNANSITQTVANFEFGETYVLSLAMNGRANDLVVDANAQARVRILVGGTNVLETDVDPVDGLFVFDTVWPTFTQSFASPGAGAYDLTIEQISTGGVSVLIDDVAILPQGTNVDDWMLMW